MTEVKSTKMECAAPQAEQPKCRCGCSCDTKDAFAGDNVNGQDNRKG